MSHANYVLNFSRGMPYSSMLLATDS